ncbi:MAG: fibronectin type III domain-containing protein, partial [Bacteroidales bacterium]|nr:fibronectin type III domain-containing protein [Bacteroidales bacterium]MBR6305364.1 fibronectin type III domain-containing protein [Bacteroidales bacterium]
MRGVRLLVIASLIAMASCKPAGPAGFAGYADAVTLSPTGNTLRYAVDVNFTAPCNWRILYWKKADGRASGQWTAARHTDGGKERVVLKFLYPETEYEFTVVPGADPSAESEVMGFKTGALPVDCPVYTVEKDGETGLKGYLMQWEASPSGYVTFCDIDGKVVWYEAFGEEIRVAWCDPAMNRLAVLT